MNYMILICILFTFSLSLSHDSYHTIWSCACISVLSVLSKSASWTLTCGRYLLSVSTTGGSVFPGKDPVISICLTFLIYKKKKSLIHVYKMFLSCKETVIILFCLHIFFLTWQCVCFFLVVCNPDCDWLGFFFQTQRLIKDRMGDSVCVEKYDIGKCLSLSYWRYGSSFFSVLICHLEVRI